MSNQKKDVENLEEVSVVEQESDNVVSETVIVKSGMSAKVKKGLKIAGGAALGLVIFATGVAFGSRNKSENVEVEYEVDNEN